jgi:hypothetical protein
VDTTLETTSLNPLHPATSNNLTPTEVRGYIPDTVLGDPQRDEEISSIHRPIPGATLLLPVHKVFVLHPIEEAMLHIPRQELRCALSELDDVLLPVSSVSS